ncbi:hypothetical protein [Tenacibaculum finnmarkense]|uniref:hypothetical protein n=2 Tax=Tenacibaculum finnmarkense TaxID=2781243 RepID=UPI001E52ED9A|nr:hypothetical protein [Tenacibaculum finnmarkense]MCD8411824.1 hypothetical protein [Tenacibaculum finnmarkense genomovar ulcerans]MCG8206613.1 hypothetical protein [Tenacibaculum finnmarkense genomovar finnmarkense]MCG8722728.1 hypothetical protein [Tenacibaculum finnmarkense]MCG8740934.1 hypothetical protein [Tenacibaculum finnmarkense]MCG8764339.1 hypothetical protein [Tenacibaculum finnmarkense]
MNSNSDIKIKSLLPHGEGIRPLVSASNLSDSDLKFLLQKRGVFNKKNKREDLVPIISSILLSPKEFNILRNKQSNKESNINRFSSQAEWIGVNKNLVDTIDENDLQKSIYELLPDDSTYQINSLNIRFDHKSNQILIEGEIKRNDWTKDVFSMTTLHPWKLIIEKTKENNIIEYTIESTVKETKVLVNKIQDLVHRKLQLINVLKDKKIQKILSTDFKNSKYVFEYLFSFTQSEYSSIKFNRIVDMEIGINEKGIFPSKFKWLKGNIGKIKLTAFQGKNIEQTDIISLGKSGILIFGEMEAEYQFNYADAKGICFIQFGFPKYYVKQKSIEFQTKISKIELEKEFSHISRIKLKRDILKEFQREKHNLFEQFKKEEKVDVSDKDLKGQYLIEM